MATSSEPLTRVFDLDTRLSISLLGYAYAVLLGGSYLVAFWEPFGFNIFPYISLKDFVTVPFVAVWALVFPVIMYLGIMLARHQLSAPPKWYLGLFLFVIFTLIFLAAVLSWKSRRFLGTTSHAGLALGLAQMTMVMSAGYVDGKKRFSDEGARYFLQQSELCSGPAYGQWIYVDKYGDEAIFINSIDKRICLLNDLKFNLVDSRIARALASNAHSEAE